MPVLNGLVLVGGKSSRMMQDKGLLNYHGKAQREYVSELLSAFCENTFMSCNAQQAAELSPAFPVVEDKFENIGPTGGILSAFEHAPNAAWLVVACDLPYLTGKTIQHLIANRNPAKTATAFINAERNFPEPLTTIWEPKSYLLLLKYVQEGNKCPRKFLMTADVELLGAPDATELQNVNTPGECEKAMQWLHANALVKK